MVVRILSTGDSYSAVRIEWPGVYVSKYLGGESVYYVPRSNKDDNVYLLGKTTIKLSSDG